MESERWEFSVDGQLCAAHSVEFISAFGPLSGIPERLSDVIQIVVTVDWTDFTWGNRQHAIHVRSTESETTYSFDAEMSGVVGISGASIRAIFASCGSIVSTRPVASHQALTWSNSPDISGFEDAPRRMGYGDLEWRRSDP